MMQDDALVRSMFSALRDCGSELDASYAGIIGLVIAVMRREKGLSQSQLSKLSGVSQPTISRIEMGESDITLPQMDLISKALNTTPGRIIDVADKFRDILRGKKIEVPSSSRPSQKSALAGAAAIATTGALLGGGPLGLLIGAVIGAIISSNKEK